LLLWRISVRTYSRSRSQVSARDSYYVLLLFLLLFLLLWLAR